MSPLTRHDWCTALRGVQTELWLPEAAKEVSAHLSKQVTEGTKLPLPFKRNHSVTEEWLRPKLSGTSAHPWRQPTLLGRVPAVLRRVPESWGASAPSAVLPLVLVNSLKEQTS